MTLTAELVLFGIPSATSKVNVPAPALNMPSKLPTASVAGPLPSVPWLYVVATHSGITLAPLLGNLVAEEIIATSPQALLTAFRPDRLLGGAAGHAPLPARRPGQQ